MSHQLRQAAAEGDLAKVTAYLAKGADVNSVHNYSGRTALTEVAIAGHVDVARALLKHGADVNWRDKAMGNTPLGWASDGGHADIVELLLKNKADPNLGSKDYLITPLMWASANGREAIVQILLAGGADVNARSSDGRTALAFAKLQKHAGVIKLLVKAGGTEVALPKPAKIAWPKVDETGATCDHTTPETVLRGFIFAMNAWEKNAAKLGASNQQKRLDTMQEVIDRFCTIKKRPYGRHGSYRTPPEYDPKEECLIDVNTVSKTRVELTTRCEKPLKSEFLYVALKKKDGWRLDAKKTRSGGGKWMNWTL